MKTITNDQGLALLAFIGGCPLRDVDYVPAMQIAQRGLVAWTVVWTASGERIEPYVTAEGVDAAIAFIDDERVCRDLGLLDESPRTLRSGEWPAVEMKVAS